MTALASSYSESRARAPRRSSPTRRAGIAGSGCRRPRSGAGFRPPQSPWRFFRYPPRLRYASTRGTSRRPPAVDLELVASTGTRPTPRSSSSTSLRASSCGRSRSGPSITTETWPTNPYARAYGHASVGALRTRAWRNVALRSAQECEATSDGRFGYAMAL